MKHKDMCNQMGKIVTVFQKYVKTVKGREVRWDIRDCKLWCGWLVGFTYKMDGKVIYGSWEDQTIFKETNRKLCALVKPWPTMREVFVPMTGFEVVKFYMQGDFHFEFWHNFVKRFSISKG